MRITTYLLLLGSVVEAFLGPSCNPRAAAVSSSVSVQVLRGDDNHNNGWNDNMPTKTTMTVSRRESLMKLLTTTAVSTMSSIALAQSAIADEPDPTNVRQFLQQYEDFTQTPSGMSFRVVTPGQGVEAKVNDRVVYDWSGYTIGYFGRPFQAKGGPQGGAFDKDFDYERTVVGAGKIVKGLEEALIGMKAGEVKQVIVPFGPLSYPQATDPNHDVVGPKPTTFSGQRSLNFVLDNPRVDRTLLFNVKVIRVDKPDGKGGFIRG